ncbi:MAG: DUF2442 domain-containing protein [gamma proteobacterium endosymbiont of Lamellibrachia anaximandri]|nr:DUF2442 domain-containing protein [gamma proteobacterium endosymbiont of Lamellibrachia anaximandri]MBL3619639.1 DUF2442 domain-containing protein [gamma proteobacterium endosymbiont of Lamellibrachia anaximandri]
MHPSVISVVPKNDHELAIGFDNGESGILDMKPFLTMGVFKKIVKPEEFNKVRVSFDTIEWDSGVDLDPEFVYLKCQGK